MCPECVYWVWIIESTSSVFLHNTLVFACLKHAVVVVPCGCNAAVQSALVVCVPGCLPCFHSPLRPTPHPPWCQPPLCASDLTQQDLDSAIRSSAIHYNSHTLNRSNNGCCCCAQVHQADNRRGGSSGIMRCFGLKSFEGVVSLWWCLVYWSMSSSSSPVWVVLFYKK